MRAYSSDLRAKIMAEIDTGTSIAATARLFRVGEETIRRYRRRRRETGTLDPRPIPGRPPTIRPDQRERLRALLVEHPTAILVDLCDQWELQTGTRVSITTMSRETRRLGWTRKKGRWLPLSRISGSVNSGSGS